MVLRVRECFTNRFSARTRYRLGKDAEVHPAQDKRSFFQVGFFAGGEYVLGSIFRKIALLNSWSYFHEINNLKLVL